jgi:hypothetical protein
MLGDKRTLACLLRQQPVSRLDASQPIDKREVECGLLARKCTPKRRLGTAHDDENYPISPGIEYPFLS